MPFSKEVMPVPVVKVATLDEALLLTGFGRFNIQSMLLSGIILMGMIMQTLGLSFIIPAAQCDLALTLQQKGWLVAIPFIAIILTSHTWGWLADTQGRRPVLLRAMLTATVFTITSSFSPNLAVFAVLQFIASIFNAATAGVSYAYLGEMFSSRYRDRMVAYGAAFVGIGTVGLPALSWLILPHQWSFYIPLLNIAYRPWRLLVVVGTLPYIISCICLIWAPESPKYLISAGRMEECLELLRKMFAVNNGCSPDDFPVQSLQTEHQAHVSTKKGIGAIWESVIEQTVPLFKPPLLKYTLLSCFVQFGIMATANGFYVWFPTILNSLANHAGNETRICDVLDVKKKTESEIVLGCDDSVAVETFQGAILVGLVFCSMYVLVGTVVDYLGKRFIIIGITGVSGICGMTSHLAYGQNLAVALFGIFQMCGACIGILTAVAVEIYPTKLRAMAVCISLMMGRVGSVFASNMVGYLLETNCGLSFYTFGGILLICSVLCFGLPGKQKSQKTEKSDVESNQTPNEEGCVTPC